MLEFERDFAAYHQAKHGIAVTNGTHALEVALLALGLGPGDEVIVPDYTFVATASAVLMTAPCPCWLTCGPTTIASIATWSKPRSDHAPRRLPVHRGVMRPISIG